MLIGADDIGHYPSMFVFIRARFRFTLIGGNLTTQLTGSHGGIGGGFQICRFVDASSPSFSRPIARTPRRACSRARYPSPLCPNQLLS